jgi:photosystem II stability/assembly factor-like uncharacterized protein
MISRRFGTGPGIYVFRSTDQGATFTPNLGVNITTASPNQGAYIEVGPDHSVYAFWYAGTTLQMRKSTDFGVTFGSPVTVYSGLLGGTNGDLGLTGIRQGTTTASGFRSSEFPHVAVHRPTGRLYVTFANRGTSPDKADVFYVVSSDGGATWSTATKVNDDATTTDQWQPTITITPNGNNIGIFYYSRQEDATNNNLFKYYGRIGRISGGVVTWDPSFAVSDVASLPEFGRDSFVNSVYMGDYNHAVSTNSAMHVVWSDNRDDYTLGPPRKDPNVYYDKIVLADPIDPNPPTALAAYSDVATPTSIRLRWTNPTTLVNGNPIPAFVTDILRDGSLISTRPSTDTVYVDGSRTTYQSYSYTLRARTTGNDSVSSDAVAAWIAGGSPVPGAPRLDSLKTDTLRARLWWTNPTTQADGTPVHDLNFTRIWRNGVVIDSVPTATRTYTDTPPPSTTAYTYQVQARNSLTPPRYSAASNSRSGRVPTYPADIAVTPATLGDSLYIAQVRGKTLNIQNAGLSPAETLYVNLSETATWLTLSRTRDTVAQGQTKPITATFNATGLTPGTYNNTIVITANDPDEPTTNVPVTLVVLPSPVIATRPDSLVKTLAPGGTGADTVTIRNTGAGPLTWNLADIPNSALGTPVRQPQADEIYPPRFDANGNRLEQAKGEPDWYTGPETDGQGGPDSAGYRWIDSDEPGGPTFSWTDIRPMGTLITFSSTDDGYAYIPFPFQFQFYGQNYGTQLHVCTNGWVSFLINTTTSFSNTAIPSVSLPNLALYPWWEDLNFASGGTAHYYHDAANARFIVQYTDVPGFSSGTGPYTFQVIFKQSGEILYQYLSMGGSTLNSATIGIENQGGTVALQVNYNANYVHNNLAIRIASDISWLTPTPTSGTVAIGDSAKVRVAYNAAGLVPGVYRGRLEITSNDYVRSPRNIPVRLNVAGHDIGVTALARTEAIDAPVAGGSGEEAVKGVTVASASSSKEEAPALELVRDLSADGEVSAASSPISGGGSPSFALADTVRFRALITNFGTFQENTYQVAWSINGVVQGTLNNTAPLEVGDVDTLTMQWNSGSPGIYTARAWTILGTDSSRGNDTASLSFTITPPSLGCDTVLNYGTIPAYATGVFGHGSATLGDTLYIVGGSSTGAASTTFARYHIPSGTWAPVGTFPEAKTGGDLVKAGNALYYIGGGSALTTPTATCFRYTPAGGWTSIAPIPTPVTGHVSEAWGDSVIFTVAGGWTTYLTTVQVYRPASNTWSTSTALPAGAGRRSFAGGLEGNQIFVAGGFSGTFRNDLRIGTIVRADSIVWTSGPNVPLGRATGSSRPGGHAVDGRFYFITGEVTPAPTSMDSIFIYVIGSGAWLPPVTGRGALTASNYWGVVSSSIIGGQLTIWFPGGALGTAFPGLMALRACSSTPPPAPGWTVQTSGVSGALYTVKAVTRDIAWAGGLGGAVIRTTNSGTTWTRVGTLGADVYAIDALDANTAFVTTAPASTYILRTTNGGARWDTVFTQASPGFLDGIDMVDATNGWAVGDPVGGKWTVLRTTNGGSSWARIATEPNQVGTEAGWNNSFEVIGSNLWFGTNASKVYRSTDNGATWTGVAAASTNTYELGFGDALRGIAAGTSGLVTTNGGSSWAASAIPGSGNINGIDASTPNEYWAVRGAVVYRSTNTGATWTTSYTGSGTYYHVDFWAGSGNTRGWVVSSTGGIAAFYGTVTAVDDPVIAEVPGTFALEQNFPNPFNPSTEIMYGLPEQATVTLRIYDILGREVVTLLDESRAAGTYRQTWNGRNATGASVASGVYFYRIEAKGVSGKNFTSLKKMVLMK